MKGGSIHHSSSAVGPRERTGDRQRTDGPCPRSELWGIQPSMMLAAVSVVGMAVLGVGVAAGIAIVVAVAVSTLVLVALVNAITMLGLLLDTLDD